MINYVKVYDINNNLIKEWTGSLEPNASGVTFAFYQTPPEAYKIMISTTINGVEQVETKVRTVTCATEQYFYFNYENYIDCLYCTGKKENVEEIERKIIVDGKKTKVVEETITKKVIQNTGFKLNEKQIFDIGASPYLFQLSGGTIINYMISDTTFDGISNKSFGDRNVVLNLIKDKVTKRYTAQQNNFYS